MLCMDNTHGFGLQCLDSKEDIAIKNLFTVMTSLSSKTSCLYSAILQWSLAIKYKTYPVIQISARYMISCSILRQAQMFCILHFVTVGCNSPPCSEIILTVWLGNCLLDRNLSYTVMNSSKLSRIFPRTVYNVSPNKQQRFICFRYQIKNSLSVQIDQKMGLDSFAKILKIHVH